MVIEFSTIILGLSIPALPVDNMSLRPGSSAAVKLYREDSPAAWQEILARYDEAIHAVGIAKSKEKDLLDWDLWWRTKLPTLIKDHGYICKSDLIQVIFFMPLTIEFTLLNRYKFI